jgi:hypothetical protein
MSGPTPPTTRAGTFIHERILLFGDSDAGKTRALLSIAKYHQTRHSDAVFYVINNDYTFEAMLRPGGEFDELENVIVENVLTMDEYINTARTFRKKMRTQDWFSTDRLDGAWEAAQDEYATKRWGEDLGSYWMELQNQRGDGDDYPVAGWDWGPINKRYRTFANNYLMRMPGHVLCMSGEKSLKEPSKAGKGGEDSYTSSTFDRVGRKPAGQKEDAKRFNSVIHMGHGLKGWKMRRANDRERDWGAEDGDNHPTREVKDFMRDYLIRIGGWKP